MYEAFGRHISRIWMSLNTLLCGSMVRCGFVCIAVIALNEVMSLGTIFYMEISVVG